MAIHGQLALVLAKPHGFSMAWHSSVSSARYSAQAGDGYGKLQDRKNDQDESMNLRRYFPSLTQDFSQPR